MTVTVFTPVYNRAHSISKVYESLLCQTNKDFEWLIINDGSTDDSDKIIDNFINSHDNTFPIRYYKKENEGLMRTINKATELANGEFFCRLDSDDYALPNLVELIVGNAHYVRDNKTLCSIVFLSQKQTGEINGFHPFNKPTISNFGEYRDKYNATGDRSEVIKTSIYRKYKFPEIPGEKFISEGVVWFRMAEKYNAMYIPEPIYVKEEVPDSITANVYWTLKQSCKGSALFYKQIINTRSFSFKYRAINAIKYYRYAFYAKSNIFKGIPLPMILIGLPLGLLVMCYDKIKY